jgi:hypothetical protein
MDTLDLAIAIVSVIILLEDTILIYSITQYPIQWDLLAALAIITCLTFMLGAIVFDYLEPTCGERFTNKLLFGLLTLCAFFIPLRLAQL